jgi:hypothetical protein
MCTMGEAVRVLYLDSGCSDQHLPYGAGDVCPARLLELSFLLSYKGVGTSSYVQEGVWMVLGCCLLLCLLLLMLGEMLL